MKPTKRFLAFILSLIMLLSGVAAMAETDTEACTIPTDGCDQGIAAETATKRDAWGKKWRRSCRQGRKRPRLASKCSRPAATR